MASLPRRPPFSSLPLDPNGPPGNAWGLYGPDDSLGALNLLTPATVAEAARTEIRTGERVSLDWQLNKPSHPSFDRPPFQHHRIVKKHPDGAVRIVNDDFLSFNTQCSSQWDGFRHYGYQKARKFYNGHGPEELDDPKILGIDAWVEKGGIVGRGVLLDYPAYCQRHNISPKKPLSSVGISLDTLLKIAKDEGVTFIPGDILFVRSGFTQAYEALPQDEQKTMPNKSPDFIGVESKVDMLKWIWESHFAAVASDAPSFEQAPITGIHTHPGGDWKGQSWESEMQGGGLLHQWVLGGWGTPIGEMFDLETLSKKCETLKRYSFFVSSVPLKVPGGVASPPNAIAIF